ncbi:C40 family peptidase [Brevibacillus laterosporus]|nr:C40 family peptidase [Brevibacillus laterosporus]ATO50886.1 peptidoglycan hydrolase [Brevibacillus laterosporus DSM 25]AYB38902.1 NlpC/P60 family protein [Brevibacillus laterosporus]MBG9804549.1 peptidoglycan hydrolase [Brevibacillus laterosporus]MBM7109636.1 Gamma-D-glutamyl-L-lysine endopeptidase [Brevibacillus laterosporus]MCR8939053.1 C40 family peptidase [Brevibacillus laterosporus]
MASRIKLSSILTKSVFICSIGLLFTCGTAFATATDEKKDKGTTDSSSTITVSKPKWEDTADHIISLGKTYMGTPYVYGAERFQDTTFDCSSYVQYLYGKFGISLGWHAREQAKQGTWIPFDQIQKGDLLFFADEKFPNETGLNKVRHVGIYLGNGKILHTYEEGIGVIISDFRNDKLEEDYWYNYFLFAKRVIPETTK